MRRRPGSLFCKLPHCHDMPIIDGYESSLVLVTIIDRYIIKIVQLSTDIFPFEPFMTDDAHAVHGSLAPTPFVAGLISTAQRCPHNWFGKQLALVLRKIVLLTNEQPLDAAVGAIRLRYYLHDNVSERKFLFMPWLYDQQERDLIARELPGDGVFVDIGANVGLYTLWACRTLTGRGTVIAIEPNPRVYDRLIFNLQANRSQNPDWPQVRTLPIAIGDKEAQLELHLDRTNLGGGSLISHPGSAGSITVSSRTLMSVLSECGAARIDILKIDIEGAEDLALFPFLSSASEQLLPRYLIIENSEHRWRSDLVSAIAQRGYAVAFRTRMNTIYHHAGT